jgi:peptidoglycan-N-acetylglucosamine deacetylase
MIDVVIEAPFVEVCASNAISLGMHVKVLVLGIALAAGLTGSASRADYPFYCGGHNGRYVALTFDDGPGATTPQVLRTFRRYRARATFFVLGRNVGGHASLIKQEKALGEVGNHSWSHPDLSRYSSGGVAEQLSSTQSAIAKAGAPRPKVFRPPYGAHNATVDAEARALGLKEILWSIDSYDSRGYSTAAIAYTVLKLVQPGAIIVMHDVIPASVRALPRILRILKARKFELVTVSELLKRDPPTLAQQRQGFPGCH